MIFLPPLTACFCTLAIHEPYRTLARQLCAEAAPVPFLVLTDEPGDFADLPVRAIRHAPTGPMAVDYRERPELMGGGRASAAYHDKRFALQAVLEEFDTAIFVDADSRISPAPAIGAFPPGLCVRPSKPESIAVHLQLWGPGRLPVFEELARHLTGGTDILATAEWCYETCYAVTRDVRASSFFDTWDVAADFMQRKGVYSGEGGVMGLAAACAGWTVDFEALAEVSACIRHQGVGPKGGGGGRV